MTGSPQHVSLLANPAAGGFHRFEEVLPAMRNLLASRKMSCEVLATSADPDTTLRTVQAAAARSTHVFACGGDGTVHAVLQGLIQSGAVLGVIPIGTANVLARNLGLPLDPLRALETQLRYTPQVVPVGRFVSPTMSRFFLLMSGCGPDGAMARSLARPARVKTRLGALAYSLHAAHMWFTRRWPRFTVRYRPHGSSEWRSVTAVACIVSRVPSLVGLLASLTPKAGLRDEFLHVHLLRSPGWISLPAWFVSSRLRSGNPWLVNVDADQLRCVRMMPGAVYAQTDAEPAGELPFELSIVPGALTLLMPPV